MRAEFIAKTIRALRYISEDCKTAKLRHGGFFIAISGGYMNRFENVILGIASIIAIGTVKLYAQNSMQAAEKRVVMQ